MDFDTLSFLLNFFDLCPMLNFWTESGKDREKERIVKRLYIESINNNAYFLSYMYNSMKCSAIIVQKIEGIIWYHSIYKFHHLLGYRSKNTHFS
jgi:hypothetical protein